MPTERVTVSFAPALLRELDRRATNRSQFIQEAVRHELLRRRREELERSLAAPHPESAELAESGLEDWASRVSEDEVSDLLDSESGTRIRWKPGAGWCEIQE
jgi:hypothetical protein